jgi:hypothetical protein
MVNIPFIRGGNFRIGSEEANADEPILLRILTPIDEMGESAAETQSPRARGAGICRRKVPATMSVLFWSVVEFQNCPMTSRRRPHIQALCLK